MLKSQHISFCQIVLTTNSCFEIHYRILWKTRRPFLYDDLEYKTIIVGTAMRNYPYYASVYVVWSKLILTDLVPYFIIILLNSFIVVKILKSSQFRARIVPNRNEHQINCEVHIFFKLHYNMIMHNWCKWNIDIIV